MSLNQKIEEGLRAVKDKFLKNCYQNIERAILAGERSCEVDICSASAGNWTGVSWAGVLKRRWLFFLRFTRSSHLREIIDRLRSEDYQVSVITYVCRGELDCAALRISW